MQFVVVEDFDGAQPQPIMNAAASPVAMLDSATQLMPVPATMSGPDFGHALPDGTQLGEFQIRRLVGEGGFGIVYLAYDVQLQREVALKEYMPSSLARRAPDGLGVMVRSERHRDAFEAGLRSFVNEARLLARFDHPALLKVHRFWEAHGTAYMAMPFYEGPTLKRHLQEDGTGAREAVLWAWLHPLLEALAVLHSAQCYHRDIAPDNILLTSAGPLLLDFGAARHVIGDMTQALTVVLKPGFAPIEQYGQDDSVSQGPWTDLYALACVMHYAITGRPPQPSVERLINDKLQPLTENVTASARYSASLLRAIDASLSLRPADRPQSVAQFRALADGRTSPHALGASPPRLVRMGPAQMAAESLRAELAPAAARDSIPAAEESASALMQSNSDALPPCDVSLPFDDDDAPASTAGSPKARRVAGGAFAASSSFVAEVDFELPLQAAPALDRRSTIGFVAATTIVLAIGGWVLLSSRDRGAEVAVAAPATSAASVVDAHQGRAAAGEAALVDAPATPVSADPTASAPTAATLAVVPASVTRMPVPSDPVRTPDETARASLPAPHVVAAVPAPRHAIVAAPPIKTAAPHGEARPSAVDATADRTADAGVAGTGAVHAKPGAAASVKPANNPEPLPNEARCSDMLLKASLGTLSREEAVTLKSNCR